MRTVHLSEGELQHLHPRNPDRLAQLDDLRRDESEVLGDERQIAERVADGIEQRLAWTRHPAAVNSRRLVRRNLPIRDEAPEVIDAQNVGEAQRGAEARHPPTVA